VKNSYRSTINFRATTEVLDIQFMSELTNCCNSSSTSDTRADGSAVRLLLDLWGFTCSSGTTPQYHSVLIEFRNACFMWMINFSIFARREVLVSLCPRYLVVCSWMSGSGGFEGKRCLTY